MNKSRMSFDMEYLRSHALGLNDTFQFRCKACGKCCKHRTDVLLTPYDVFRIARNLGRTPDDIIDRYCVISAGANSHMPIVRIRPNPPDNACPFLRNRKCIVHKDKPLVCAAFPLSRICAYGSDAPFYVLQPDVTCGHRDRIVSVQQWMGALCNEENEWVGKEWGDLSTIISMGLMNRWKEMPDATKEGFLDTLFPILYLNYDVKKPFIPQLENNAVGALLLSSDFLGTEDVPSWLAIPDYLTAEAKALLLLRKAYHLYKLQWCAQRGLALIDGLMMQDEPDAEHFISLKEFQKQFCDHQGMEALLSAADYDLLLNLGEVASLLVEVEKKTGLMKGLNDNDDAGNE